MKRSRSSLEYRGGVGCVRSGWRSRGVVAPLAVDGSSPPRHRRD